MSYIQRKDEHGVETVDQFEDRKEAYKALIEYRLSDGYASYYLSQRACKHWNK